MKGDSPVLVGGDGNAGRGQQGQGGGPAHDVPVRGPGSLCLSLGQWWQLQIPRAAPAAPPQINAQGVAGGAVGFAEPTFQVIQGVLQTESPLKSLNAANKGFPP